MQKSSRKLLVVLIGLLVLGFVVYRSTGLINLADFSGTKLLHAIRNANPFLLILSIVAIYACYALRSLRWKVFQRNLGPSRFGTIYAMTLAGFAAIFLLGRAGEPVRPLLLARKERLPIADLFGIYTLERLIWPAPPLLPPSDSSSSKLAVMLAKLRPSWKLPRRLRARCYPPELWERLEP